MFVAEVTEGAEILTEEGERRSVDADYLELGYDTSVLHHRRDVVLTATFRLAPADPERMRRVVRENLGWRASAIRRSRPSPRRAPSSRRSRGSAPAG